MKKFLFVLLMLFVVGIAVMFLFLEKLDGIVKNKIEEIGSRTLGQPVTVGSVNMDLQKGSGEISGLEIQNPQGFSDKNAFQMGTILADIDLSSISQSPLVLNELSIEEPIVSLEVREDGVSNLDEILVHLQTQSAGKTKDSSEPSEESDPVLLVIENLRIVGAQLTVRHPELGEDPRRIILPEIQRRNVGGKTGAEPSELAVVIVEAIAEEGAKEALKTEAKKQAGKLFDKASQSLFKRLDSSDDEATE